MRRLYFYSLVALGISLVLYVPFIMHGGFIVDDWGIVTASAANHNPIDLYKSWFPLFSNRPLAPVFITITGLLFGSHPLGYIVVTLVLFMAALTLIGAVLEPYFGRRFGALFIALAATPIIASTVLFSPGMQITATASYAMWALSLWCLSRFLSTRKAGYGIAAYTLVLACLMTYEIILPLLIITVAFPYIAGKFKDYKSYILRYILPLLAVVIIDLLFQKAIMPHFMVVYSRFKPVENLHGFGHIFRIWIEAVFIKTPELWGKGVSYAVHGQTSLAAVLTVVVGWIVLLVVSLQTKIIKQKQPLVNGGVLALAALLSVTLYLLTTTIPNTAGYDNRGLSATWMTWSLLLAYFGSFTKRWILTAVVLIVIGLSWLSFVGERSSYIDSYETQVAILNDCIRLAHAEHVPSGATIIGDVPHTLPGAFNHEDGFNDQWNFGGALSLYSHGYLRDGITLNREKVGNGLLTFNGDLTIIDGYFPVYYDNVWFYTYNPETHASTIEPLTSREQLVELSKHLKI